MLKYGQKGVIMKKILAIILLCTLFMTNIYASETASQTPDMTKQEMARLEDKPSESAPTESVVNMAEPKEDSSRSLMAVILAVVLIMVIVGLVSTFITKYALSMRNNNSIIYETKSDEEQAADNIKSDEE